MYLSLLLDILMRINLKWETTTVKCDRLSIKKIQPKLIFCFARYNQTDQSWFCSRAACKIVEKNRFEKWARCFDWGLSNLEHLFDLLNEDDRQVEMLAVHLPDPSNCYASLRTIDSQQQGKDKHILLDISTDHLLQTVLNQVTQSNLCLI